MRRGRSDLLPTILRTFAIGRTQCGSRSANFDRWRSLDEESYRLEKLRWYDRIRSLPYVPDYRGRGRHRYVHPQRSLRYSSPTMAPVRGHQRKQFDGHASEAIYSFAGPIGALSASSAASPAASPRRRTGIACTSEFASGCFAISLKLHVDPSARGGYPIGERRAIK